jgi:hypothetical protein
MISARQTARVDDLDTMVDMPAAQVHHSPSDVPPPKNSECRALLVPRPPRPTPRATAKATAKGNAPPPLPTTRVEAEAAAETRTMEIDPSCIEEVRALVAAAPPARVAPRTSRRLVRSTRAVALFVLYVALAAIAWVRTTVWPATRNVASAARARIAIEWARSKE